MPYAVYVESEVVNLVEAESGVMVAKVPAEGERELVDQRVQGSLWQGE